MTKKSAIGEVAITAIREVTMIKLVGVIDVVEKHQWMKRT